MSEKRRTLALVKGVFKYAEIASARGRLLLQVRIFMPVFAGLSGAAPGSAGVERAGL
jgi:hypothetical protein